MRRFFLTFNTMLLLCVMALPVSANMISGTDKSPNQSGPIVGTCYALSANFVASGISGNICYGNMGSDGGVKMRTGQDGNRVVFEVLAPYVVKKFTLEAYSNNTDATITVTKVEVDGVETTFTGGSFPSKTTASNSNTSGNITVSGISATESIAIYFDNSEVTGNSTENSGNKNKQIMAYYELEWEGDGEEAIITFADSNVKALCIENWDTSGDGELSVKEAAAVTDLGTVFKRNSSIISFDELQFFKGLTSIGGEAFYMCTELKSITFPTSVTEIHNLAFEFCTSLTSITIPNSVTSIGRWAFRFCSNLSSITIPNSVVSIGESAFGGYSGLESIMVEGNNPNYDSRDNCNAIIRKSDNKLITGCKNTVIPNSVTSIGNEAFRGCTDLTSIAIPNSVTSIDGRAFISCSNLTSIIIPNSVLSIGGSAFEGCSKLIFVRMETANPVIIDESVFTNRANATLYVPTGSKAAYETAGVWQDFGTIIEYTGDGNIVFVDSNVKAICVENWDTSGDGELSVEEAAAVTDLGMVFKENKTILSFDELQFFTGLTSIGEQAFYWCLNLTSITIPSHVTSIGNFAFYQCNSLTSINIPNRVNSIGNDVFGGCSSLTSVSIPNGLTSIGEGVFSACKNLTAVTIPNSVTAIGDLAFRNCTNLTSISIPNSVTTIGAASFQGCNSLTSVFIPNSVTSIGERAFGYCGAIESITVDSNNPTYDSRDNSNSIIRKSDNTLITGCKNTVIPNNVTAIGDFAFFVCADLTSMTIPNSVTSIGSYAFQDCTSLTSIGIPNSVTTIGISSFVGCSGLTSIVIPNSVNSIGKNAFSGCSSIESVIVDSDNPTYDSRYNCNAVIQKSNNTLVLGCKNTIIPNSVTCIGEWAFSGCTSLTSITIPNSVTSIGNNAFRECYGLTSVRTLIESPFATNAFGYIYYAGKIFDNTVLYVLKGTKSLYEVVADWNQFVNIEEIGNCSVTLSKDVVTYASDLKLDFTTPVSGLKAYVVSDVMDGKAVLTEVTDKVPAGTGLILKGTAGETYEIPYCIGDVSAIANKLVGVTIDTAIGGNDLDYILSDGKFVKASAGTLAAGKAYLKLDAALARGIIDMVGDVTGIGTVERSTADNEVYNLNGQRISKPAKGLYIANGKKVMVK